MISILEINTDELKTKVLQLIDNHNFQMALILAGSLLSLKKIFKIYKNKKDRDKYLGVASKSQSKTNIDWEDVLQSLNDNDFFNPKK